MTVTPDVVQNLNMPKPKFADETAAATKTGASASVSEISEMPFNVSATQANIHHLPIYVDPDDLINADDVRPNETEAEHLTRVKALAAQIAADGQSFPVKVTQTGNHADGQPILQIVDGQGRVDAIRYLNNKNKSNGEDPRLVWCVMESGEDAWAAAIHHNLNRVNYNDLQIAELIKEAAKRYGWDAHGGGKKLAKFFGITEQHLIEFNKIAAAPEDVKEKIRSGELSRFAALKLMEVAGAGDDEESTEKRAKVVKKSKEVSQEEVDRRYAASRKGIQNVIAEVQKEGKAAGKSKAAADPTPISTAAKAAATAPAPAPEPKPVAKVEAKHVVEAARAIAEETGSKVPIIKRNRAEILNGLVELQAGLPEGYEFAREATAFIQAVHGFANGDRSQKQLTNKWNALLGIS